MYDINRTGQIYKIVLGVIVIYQIILAKTLSYSVEMFSLSVLDPEKSLLFID